MPRQAASQIDEAAAAWVAKLDRRLTPGEEQQLQAWLASDDRHLGAFGRMHALSLHTERAAALGSDYRPDRFRPASAELSRRQALRAAGLVLGVAAAGSGAYWSLRASGRHATGRGEVRSIALADGSVVTLNTASEILVRYSRARRTIRLLKGEALFDVAKDRERPFVVDAGDMKVRAVGTRFTVRRLDRSPIQVLVQEGVVEVSEPAAAGSRKIRVTANMRATKTAVNTVTASVAPAEIGRELVWRQGSIAFEGETLAQASSEFARYSDIHIVIDDPDLAGEQVSGMYSAHDPVGFGRAIAEAFSARVEIRENEVRLYR